MHIRGDVGGETTVPRERSRQSVLDHHGAVGNTAGRGHPNHRKRKCKASDDARLILAGSLRGYQTLRFVQSLPKRERQPLSNKFKNADPLGMIDAGVKEIPADSDSHRPSGENAGFRSTITRAGWEWPGARVSRAISRSDR